MPAVPTLGWVDRRAQKIQFLRQSFHRSARIGCARLASSVTLQRTLSANGTSRPSILIRCKAAFGSNPDIEATSPNDRLTHKRHILESNAAAQQSPAVAEVCYPV